MLHSEWRNSNTNFNVFGLNPQASALEASLLTITPLRWSYLYDIKFSAIHKNDTVIGCPYSTYIIVNLQWHPYKWRKGLFPNVWKTMEISLERNNQNYGLQEYGERANLTSPLSKVHLKKSYFIVAWDFNMHLTLSRLPLFM